MVGMHRIWHRIDSKIEQLDLVLGDASVAQFVVLEERKLAIRIFPLVQCVGMCVGGLEVERDV